MRETKEKIKILFLCTGNACRSQMAEGWARHLKSDVIEAYSAGVWPVGVSSRAIQVMAEAGVDISSQTSDHVDDFLEIDFDYVITLCDNARECCPVFSGKAKLIHKPFEDPTFVVGSTDEIMRAFRQARDQIREFVETLPESLADDE
ncbi:MAG: arsenate reductase [Planctomycetes bacterium RBG_13_50_24]|nr:MAG: arsenate reductase [Planctomycetes bacterium RBG_13_50_24]